MAAPSDDAVVTHLPVALQNLADDPSSVAAIRSVQQFLPRGIEEAPAWVAMNVEGRFKDDQLLDEFDRLIKDRSYRTYLPTLRLLRHSVRVLAADPDEGGNHVFSNAVHVLWRVPPSARVQQYYLHLVPYSKYRSDLKRLITEALGGYLEGRPAGIATPNNLIACLEQVPSRFIRIVRNCVRTLGDNPPATPEGHIEYERLYDALESAEAAADRRYRYYSADDPDNLYA